MAGNATATFSEIQWICKAAVISEAEVRRSISNAFAVAGLHERQEMDRLKGWWQSMADCG